MDNIFYNSVDIAADVEEQFGLNNLLRTHLYSRLADGSWRERAVIQPYPGNVLFDKVVSSTESGDGFVLNYSDGRKYFLQPTDQGVDFRLYLGESPAEAKVMYLLCRPGNGDLYQLDIAVELEFLSDDTTIVHNKSVINNVPYTQVLAGGDIEHINWSWLFYGVEDQEFVQGGKIANDGTDDYNRGAGDHRFAIITKDPNYPILKKAEINDQGTNGAHYYFDYETNVKDSDYEFLTLTLYSRLKKTHSGDREMDGDDVYLDINELFPPKPGK